jgi:hypothetical protein
MPPSLLCGVNTQSSAAPGLVKLARARSINWRSAIAVKNQLSQVEQSRAAEQQASFHRWAAEQDGLFIAAHPELNDLPTKAAAAQNAVQALEAVGFSGDEIRQAWNSSPLLRDHRVQDLLLAVGKSHAARQQLRSARNARPSPVLRPGGGERSFRAETEGDQLRRQFAGPLDVRKAGQFLASSRRTRN